MAVGSADGCQLIAAIHDGEYGAAIQQARRLHVAGNEIWILTGDEVIDVVPVGPVQQGAVGIQGDPAQQLQLLVLALQLLRRAVADAAQALKAQGGQQQQDGDAQGGTPAAVAGCHTFLFQPGAQELHRIPRLPEA